MAAETAVKKKAKKEAGAASESRKSSEGKRKRDADADAGASAQPSKAPGTTEGAPSEPSRKKHKRGHAGQPQEAVDPAEAARRERQRLLQARAMQLRAEGKTYVAPKKGSKPPKEATGGKGAERKDGERKGRHYLGDKQPGWRPFSSVEVIVLPIFWNNNKEEKSAVLAASERARDILASAGLSVDMDASNKYTPGQKMKYWETMGVRVRVELGPRDVANGNCVVALSTKAPGEVAAKGVVNMKHKMLDAVRNALQKAKSAGQDVQEKAPEPKRAEASADEDEEENERGRQDAVGSEGEETEEGAVAAALATAKARKGGVLNKTANPEGRKLKHKRGAAAVDAAAPGEEPEEAAEPAGGKQAYPPASADALEDDFGDIVEFEAEEDKLTLSKKERLKKAVKQAKAKHKAERFASRQADEVEGGAEGAGAEVKVPNEAIKGPKKPKVVKF
ncbi:hypothetical protein GPECTOR_214g437 [Gonium pectorale]|uniref:Anticodon-binding domain-containing protein n=1 Tax=Gonium pectorale TaxID=33097 RepID=A0A150FXZ2_GONPE|nr:hypothetical protein GPECTOR_214g437 [Gonium pectorale]|eukprot:KXZ42055.1 hypothetical protein GPECTOR_214g437 [Gonium pectorale]